MSDRTRLVKIWRQRQWGSLAAIVAANTIMIVALTGVVLLLLLGGLYSLDWLGALPCICS